MITAGQSKKIQRN